MHCCCLSAPHALLRAGTKFSQQSLHRDTGDRLPVRTCYESQTSWTHCIKSWQMPLEDAPQKLWLFCDLEESQEFWGPRGSTSAFRKGSIVPWVPPRAQWLLPDPNDPLITHRKWVWTLHTGRWLVPLTRCRKPFQGNALKCLNILFLSLLFLYGIPQFEWEPLFANWSGCSILWTPWRIFHLYSWQLQDFISSSCSFMLLQHCCGEGRFVTAVGNNTMNTLPLQLELNKHNKK